VASPPVLYWLAAAAALVGALTLAEAKHFFSFFPTNRPPPPPQLRLSESPSRWVSAAALLLANKVPYYLCTFAIWVSNPTADIAHYYL